MVFSIKCILDKFVQKTLELHCFESKAPPSSRSSAQLQEAAEAPSRIIFPCQVDEPQEPNRVSLKCSRYHSTHSDSKQIEPYPSHTQTQHQRGLTCWNTGFHSHIWRAPTCHPTNRVVNHFTSDKLMVVPSHLNATKTQTLSNYLFIYLLDFRSNFCLRKNTQTLDHTLTSCYYTDFQIPIIFLPPHFSPPPMLLFWQERIIASHHPVAPQNSVQNRRSHTVGKHVEKKKYLIPVS